MGSQRWFREQELKQASSTELFHSINVNLQHLRQPCDDVLTVKRFNNRIQHPVPTEEMDLPIGNENEMNSVALRNVGKRLRDQALRNKYNAQSEGITSSMCERLGQHVGRHAGM